MYEGTRLVHADAMDQNELVIFVVAAAAAERSGMPLHQAVRGVRATAPDTSDATAEDLTRWVDVASKTFL